MVQEKKILILLFNIPKKKASFRVKIWRELKKIGAQPLLSSAWWLPAKDVAKKYILGIAKEIRKEGGQAKIIVGKVI